MELLKHNALNVHVVIDAIKDFVYDPETLRSCRRVNNTWLIYFNKRALEESTINGLKSIAISNADDLGFSKFAHDGGRITDLNIRRIKVENTDKFIQHEKVVNFFQERGNQLRFMSFKARNNDEMSLVHLQFIENVLYKWCTKLEEFQLIGLNENNVTGTVEDQDVQNLSLRKLVVNYEGTSIPLNNMTTSVIQKILERAKSLDSFVLIGPEYDPRFGDISDKIMNLICSKSKNLTTLEFFKVQIGKRDLRLIQSAGWVLKKFVLHHELDWDVKISHLNSFLEAHSKSLKYLHFEVSIFVMDASSELRVHSLKNLEVLKIAVDKIKMGTSGLMGKLEKLHHLTLWGNCVWGTCQRLNFETMFANKVSSSIKTLCLDESYVSQVSVLTKWCPSVSELSIEVSEKTIKDFIANLNEMVNVQNVIEDLKVIVNFQNFAVNDELMKSLFAGICRHKYRTLKFAAVHWKPDFPCVRYAWIESGLIGNDNTFFRIVLEGFYIRDDEISAIGDILTKRSNFTTWVDCKAIGIHTGKVTHLKEETFFRENVKALSKKIVESVRENAYAHVNV